MQIEHIILQMLNTNQNVLLCAKEELEMSQETIETFVETKLKKVFSSNLRKAAQFYPESAAKKQLEAYNKKECSFIELTDWFGNRLFEIKQQYDCYEESALLIAEVVHEERRYLVLLDQMYRFAMTCYVDFEIERNTLLEKPTLSNNVLKGDVACIIELSDLSLSIIEEPRIIQGSSTLLYLTQLLSGTSTPSFEESRKVIETIGKKMSEQYEMDSLKVTSKMKQMMKEAVESNEQIDVEEIAHQVFQTVPYAKDVFVSEVKQAGIASAISTEYAHLPKSGKVTKLTTDQQIEVILPVEFMNESNCFEMIHHDDDTYSILIKNIKHLKSR